MDGLQFNNELCTRSSLGPGSVIVVPSVGNPESWSNRASDVKPNAYYVFSPSSKTAVAWAAPEFHEASGNQEVFIAETVEVSVCDHPSGQSVPAQPTTADLLGCDSALGPGDVFIDTSVVNFASAGIGGDKGIGPGFGSFQPHTSHRLDRCIAAERVAMHILICNDIAYRQTGKHVFNPTQRFAQTIGDLPVRTCRDERESRAFVQDLYEVLIEASHSNGGRSLGRLRPFVTHDESRILFCIKDLRNRWACHDPDQSSAEAAFANERLVSEWLRWLGLDGLQGSADEYRIMRDRILDRVEQLLETLASRIAPKC